MRCTKVPGKASTGRCLCRGRNRTSRRAPPFMFARGSEDHVLRVRQKVRELDAGMPVYDMKTLDRQLDETLGTERLIAILSACFGVLATLLAALGLYGVMAFVVARRTKEIGLRMALGAPQGSVIWMVLRESLVLLCAGLAIGIPTSFALSRYVSTQLYGVKPADLWAAAGALVILVERRRGRASCRRARPAVSTRSRRCDTNGDCVACPRIVSLAANRGLARTYALC